MIERILKLGIVFTLIFSFSLILVYSQSASFSVSIDDTYYYYIDDRGISITGSIENKRAEEYEITLSAVDFEDAKSFDVECDRGGCDFSFDLNSRIIFGEYEMRVSNGIDEVVRKFNIGFINEERESSEEIEDKLHHTVSIDEPGKWEVPMNHTGEDEFVLFLPEQAQNIEVFEKGSQNRKEGRREKQMSSRGAFQEVFPSDITSRFVDNHVFYSIDSLEQGEYVVKFETPPPKVKKEILETGSQQIHISSDLPYKEIDSYVSLEKEVTSRQELSFYWVRDTGKQSHPYTLEDSNDSGLYDTLHWITPHLSNQTFQVDYEDLPFLNEVYVPVGDIQAQWELCVGDCGLGHFNVLNDGVEQPNTPDTTSYIRSRSNQEEFDTHRTNQITQENIEWVEVWVYAETEDNSLIIVDIVSQGVDLGSGLIEVNEAENWFLFNLTGVDESQLDTLDLTFESTRPGGGGPTEAFIYAWYANVFYKDNQLPTVEFTPATQEEDNLYQSDSFFAEIQANDDISGLDNISIYLEDDLGNVVDRETAFGVEDLSYIFTNLDDGEYYYYGTAYDNSGNKNVTETRSIRINTQLSYDKFKPWPLTTNLSLVPDFESVANLVLEIREFGRIEWQNNVDVSTADFDSNVFIEDNFIDIQETFLDNSLNSEVELFFYNLSWDEEPIPVKNGEICLYPNCITLDSNYVNGTYSFISSGTSNFSTTNQVPWFDPDWNRRIEIQINSSQIVGEHENFPYLVTLEDDILAEFAQDTGDDILVTDGDGETQLSHELESFDNSTGELTLWTKVPIVSENDSRRLYVYFENPSASNQENVGDVWSENYSGVWHMNDETPSTIADSSSFSNTGDKRSSDDPIEAEGLIGESQRFFADDEYIDTTTNGFEVTQGTISLWFNLENLNDRVRFFGHTEPRNNWNNRMFLGYDNMGGNDNDFYIGIGDTWNLDTNIFAPSANTWYHATLVYDSGNYGVYVDGQQVSSGTYSGFNQWADGFDIGNTGRVDDREYAPGGFVDEVRVSSIPRSGDWIATEYNNQFDNNESFEVVQFEILRELSYDPPVLNDTIINQDFISLSINQNSSFYDRTEFRLFNSTDPVFLNTSNDLNKTTINWTNLNDGLYFFDVVLFDTLGGNTTLDQLNVTLDTTPPEVEFIPQTPQNNSIIFQDLIINVSQFDINYNRTIFRLYNETDLLNETIKTDITDTTQIFKNLSEQKYFVNVTVEDLVGNTNTTETREFEFKDAFIDFDILAPTNNSKLFISDDFLFEAKIEGIVENFTVFVWGEDEFTVDLIEQNSTNWNASSSVTQPGNYEFEFVAENQINQVNKTINVIVLNRKNVSMIKEISSIGFNEYEIKIDVINHLDFISNNSIYEMIPENSTGSNYSPNVFDTSSTYTGGNYDGELLIWNYEISPQSTQVLTYDLHSSIYYPNNLLGLG